MFAHPRLIPLYFLLLAFLCGCQTGGVEATAVNSPIIGADPSMSRYALSLAEAYNRQYPEEVKWTVQTFPEEQLWIELDQNKIQAAIHLRDSPGDYWTSSLGWTAIVLAVNRQTSIRDLTPLQARDIFLGVIKNWSEVGGERGNIVRYSFPMDSVMEALMEKTVLEGNRISQDSIALSEAWSMRDAITMDSQGVGYLLCNDIQGEVIPLTMGHKKIDYPSLLKRDYPFRIPVFLSAQKSPGDDVLRFVGWAQSVGGQSVFSSLCDLGEE